MSLRIRSTFWVHRISSPSTPLPASHHQFSRPPDGVNAQRFTHHRGVIHDQRPYFSHPRPLCSSRGRRKCLLNGGPARAKPRTGRPDSHSRMRLHSKEKLLPALQRPGVSSTSMHPPSGAHGRNHIADRARFGKRSRLRTVPHPQPEAIVHTHTGRSFRRTDVRLSGRRARTSAGSETASINSTRGNGASSMRAWAGRNSDSRINPLSTRNPLMRSRANASTGSSRSSKPR